ncbi:hypothetical protein CesoFtcFv8_006903 [Champsocephalus esox]|uniref:Uncharacterized protein n=1 Tax=Champsocephalus esox TaxID=159716 RepID=A0AAN8CDH1_9TELE|nr:hypothetical protein CesoFtcFv8_006903 [Champsocephalus esox]
MQFDFVMSAATLLETQSEGFLQTAASCDPRGLTLPRTESSKMPFCAREKAFELESIRRLERGVSRNNTTADWI